MANDCLPSIQACALRVARLDPNGVPTPGIDNLYVTDTMVTLTAEPQYLDGAEFEVQNACGDLVVNFLDVPRLKRVNITLNISAPDPELSELMAGGSVLTDGAAVGWEAPPLLTRIQPYGVSLELWTKRLADDGDLDATFPYFHWVFPRTKLRIGAKNFQNGPMDNPFSGFAIENPNWYDGPLGDWPVSSDRVFAYLPVAATDLPTPVCGYQTTPAS